MACDKCGKDLYRALAERNPSAPKFTETFEVPSMPHPNVTIPMEKLKQWRSNHNELAQFAAWVCDVPLKSLCRLDMMSFIASVRGLAKFEQGDSL